MEAPSVGPPFRFVPRPLLSENHVNENMSIEQFIYHHLDDDNQ